MNLADDIKIAVAEGRKRGTQPKTRALYDLNMWLGAERRKLNEEYARRREQIEEQPDTVIDKQGVSPEVLRLVAEAHHQGMSRSNLRLALSKQTLTQVDEIIALALKQQKREVQTGETDAFTLRPTGEHHAKGWPKYAVTLNETGEVHKDVYLVVPNGVREVARAHMRLMPAPAGSVEILDQLWDLGVGHSIWEIGKDS